MAPSALRERPIRRPQVSLAEPVAGARPISQLASTPERALTARSRRLERVRVAGKFLFAGETKFYLRGVTYGTFSGPDGFPAPEVVEADFANMVLHGINTVRTYSVPPTWVLNLAASHGLRVLVGIPWEQHLTFLDQPQLRRTIERRIDEGVRSCAGHPAVLGYAVGNEIPSSIVRWHGPAAIERFIGRLVAIARRADPDALVTYVNFPSTEYLELPFVDFIAFNVYLEEAAVFAAYISRLQALAGDTPLVLAELGLDELRNGQTRQADAVESQLRGAFAGGCAGAFVFSWTDEWCRDGVEIEDWNFGLVQRDRDPKPALATAQRVFNDVPLAPTGREPSVSVVVCTHNGAATLEPCLAGLLRLNYRDYEVIVIDDGSTDASAAIAERYGVRLISTPPRGLSAARNTGADAAGGAVVAFLDDDCVPDADWLRFAIARLESGDDAGVGGPNIPPVDDGFVARCVARAPGGPTHVLLSDTDAEHVAGCNMIFWKSSLQQVGAFDERFWQAGDDVDLCWRIRDADLTLGFSPSAVVWHKRRATVSAYLRQQRSYGRSEALLERKWPERYNGTGHVTWSGQVYGGGLRPRRKRLIDYGIWGMGLFQSANEPRSSTAVAPLMPESYIALLALALAAVVAPWVPLLRLPLLNFPVMPVVLATALLAMTGHALLAAVRVTRGPRTAGCGRLAEIGLVALLVLLQPLARLSGRTRAGLTPWRRRPWGFSSRARNRVRSIWSEHGRNPAGWLTLLEDQLKASHAVVARGGRYDRWDLSVRVGAMGTARVQLAIEEHGQGSQLLRWRVSRRPSPRRLAVIAGLGIATALEALTSPGIAAFLIGSITALLVVRLATDCIAAAAAIDHVLSGWVEPDPTQRHQSPTSRIGEPLPAIVGDPR